jgi:hypothetical protein
LATAGVVLVGLPFAATAIFLARAVWIGLRRSAIHSPRMPPADGED